MRDPRVMKLSLESHDGIDRSGRTLEIGSRSKWLIGIKGHGTENNWGILKVPCFLNHITYQQILFFIRKQVHAGVPIPGSLLWPQHSCNYMYI